MKATCSDAVRLMEKSSRLKSSFRKSLIFTTCSQKLANRRERLLKTNETKATGLSRGKIKETGSE